APTRSATGRSRPDGLGIAASSRNRSRTDGGTGLTILGEPSMKADVRRSAAPFCAVVALVLLAATGCGSSGKNSAPSTTPTTTTAVTTTPQTRPLTGLDLVNIIGSAPDTPAGADYAADSRSTTLTLADLPRRTSEERATVRAFRLAGFRLIYQ